MRKQLGPYQILELIGRGGMGVVFKGYHPALDRHVAVKILSSALSADPAFVQRFKNEAQIIARLEHPNILPVYDFAIADDTAYLVMKLVIGSSLSEKIGSRGMPPGEAIKVLEAVGQALTHAHRRNIVHRDIKPDNILIDENNWVYLSDFGMAKMLSKTNPDSQELVMGTPGYMSPEQAKGKDFDHRTDVYSMAVLAFHMLTGAIPFRGNTPIETLYKLIEEPFPNATLFNPSLPKLADSLLQKGAAKAAEDRFESAQEFVSMLAAVLTADTRIPETRNIFRKRQNVAVVPFSVKDDESLWMSEAAQEMLIAELEQNQELYLLPGDQVTRMCRNIVEPNSQWTAGPLQRFFELSRADYMIVGSVNAGVLQYEVKISTSFETVERGEVRGTIPFHLAHSVAQNVRAALGVSATGKVVSAEQFFHGNIALLRDYAGGLHAFRDGMYLDAERFFRSAVNSEPGFAPAHLLLAQVLKLRGLPHDSRVEAESAYLLSAHIPAPAGVLVKARCCDLLGRYEDAAEIFHDFHEETPNVVEYLIWWGDMLIKCERFEEAGNVFYELCEKEGRLGLGWQRLASIELLQEKYEQAWYHFKRAERLYKIREHSGGQAACCQGLAEIAERRGEWETAIDYYLRATQSFARLQWTRGVAQCKYRLALCHLRQHAHEPASALLRECISLFAAIGDLSGELSSLRDLLSEPLQPAEGLELSERLLSLAAEIRDENTLCSAVPLKLHWLVEAGQSEQTLVLYSSYYEMLLRLSPLLLFPLSQIEIARALLLQNRLHEAQEQVDQACQAFMNTDNRLHLAAGLMVRGEVLLLLGRATAAHLNLDEAAAIADDLYDLELALKVELFRARLFQIEGQSVQLLQTYMRSMKIAEQLGRSEILEQIQSSIRQLRL
jgi:serine/threonine protein kinase